MRLSLKETPAERDVDFGSGYKVRILHPDAILVAEAEARAVQLWRALEKSSEAGLEFGIQPGEISEAMALAPLGFTRWVQAISLARILFVSWRGRELDGATLDAENIAVFVRDPSRMQRVLALPYEDKGDLLVEGEPFAAGSNGNSAAGQGSAGTATN